MRLDFYARNAEVTGEFRAHVEPRLEALHRHFEKVQGVKVVINRQRNWRSVEITVDADGLLLRAEERSDDELTSFDKALAAIERQLDRYRERVRDRHHRRGHEAGVPAPAEEREEPPAEVEIRRSKTVSLEPMTPEEAVLQMELLGHDFFMYRDAETEQIGLVYRRKDGGFGVLLAE
jgi:putative sigma-54 modulation protein